MAENNIDINNYEPAACFDEVKRGRGRPRKVLNATGIAVVSSLAQVMCTEEEIAACLNTTVETLHSESNYPIFSECYKKGQQQGKTSLRHSQFQLAKINATMAIFLGKQYLDQSEKTKQEDDSKAQLDKLCDAIRSVNGGKNG